MPDANQKEIRVLIVDDSFFMRQVVGDLLRADKEIEVVGEAADGAQAIERIAELHPTVVTLDIEMPIMDGLEALRAIVKSPGHPAVVMVSGYVPKGADLTLQCLTMGAADFVLKPSGSFSLDMDEVKDELIEKVKDAINVDTTKTSALNLPPAKLWRYQKTGGVVVIGASTGGPAALEVLLPEFPQNFPYPIVVAQHLPKEFADSFVERLGKRCQLRVLHARQDMALAPGAIYVATGSTVTSIEQANARSFFKVQSDTEDRETPSINTLMRSAAEVYGNKTVGVILSGMGKDGAEGMSRIKQVGGRTVVEDKSTTAVFGMGKEVVARGRADAVVPLDQIMEEVSQYLV